MLEQTNQSLLATDAGQRLKWRGVLSHLEGRFDLVFVDTGHDDASVRLDIEAVLPLLATDGLLAFHDYPDPGWPDVRRVVDEYAGRFGWRRVAQADFLGVFRLADATM